MVESRLSGSAERLKVDRGAYQAGAAEPSLSRLRQGEEKEMVMKKFTFLLLFLVVLVSSSLLADGRGKRGRGYYRDGYSEFGEKWDKHPYKRGGWKRGYGYGTRGYPAYGFYPAYPAYPPPPAYGYYSCPPYPGYGSYYRRGAGPYYGGGRPYPRRGGVRGRISGEIIF